ncbi:hypothetical protein COL26b_009130 [Colletotrichum chrysophilum]|uniref:uncharacterized protein n=1 Tax=Colletotrichum chrysophilum TaxID=1836956 RepID=UPI00230057B7|nr:uncharacterized protein COL26b_009130 [Colletotrichum chrysophilum]KAJ0372688.1 hypothetical protein COL26b_009130 [Colletotrichum chrysophilum]
MSSKQLEAYNAARVARAKQNIAKSSKAYEDREKTHPLKFADNMYEVLMAKRPPTLDFFRTLPKPNKSNPVWGVYTILMEKANHPAKLYVGSGTNADHGVVTRLRDYKRETLLPQLVLKALQEGYSISHAGLLCWYAMPKPGQAPIARLRVITVKATMAFVFFAGRPCKMDVLWDDMLPWTRDGVSWQPLCTHTAFLQKPPGDLDMSEEELESYNTQRRERALVQMKINSREYEDGEKAVTFTTDDLSTSYQPAGKGDGKITGSSSKSDASDRASAILPTNKDVVLRQLRQMMNAIDSAPTQQEAQSAAEKLKNYTLWPRTFRHPNAAIINAEFLQQLSTLLVSSPEDMSIRFNQLGGVLWVLAQNLPRAAMPTSQDLRTAMYFVRELGFRGWEPASSYTRSESQSRTSTEWMEYDNNEIDRMLDTFKRVMAHLTSRVAATNNGKTRMPPAPDFNVLGKLADTIDYDQAALITEEAYSHVVALVGDLFNAVFEEPLKMMKTNHQIFLDEHATNDNDRASDRTDDRMNSALFVNDDIYNP